MGVARYGDEYGRAVAFLRAQQNSDGSFKNTSSAHPDCRRPVARRSPFFTSLILDILAEMGPEKDLDTLRGRGVRYIKRQASEHLTFNYWARGSRDFKTMPYPDDLDDTACALAALYRYDSNELTGSDFAKVAHALIAVERREGGPYGTWFVSDQAGQEWCSVDPVVNANVLHFMSLVGVELPNVVDFIDERIANNTFRSPFYYSDIASIFFISRGYKGRYADRLIRLVQSGMHDSGWDNPFESCMALLALHNLGVPIGAMRGKYGQLLRDADQFMRAYPLVPFDLPPANAPVKHYGGSAALTVSLYLALVRVMGLVPSAAREVRDALAARIKNEIAEAAVSRVARVDEDMGSKAAQLVSAMIARDGSGQITLTPYYLWLSLGGSSRRKIPEAVVAMAGLANLLGWLAYTIYDDFFDAEGDPVLLPIAAIAMREAARIYEELDINASSGFMQLFHTVLGRVDAANYKEIRDCHQDVARAAIKVSDQDSIAVSEKSLGHALCAVCLLCGLGYAADSLEVRRLLAYFQNVLAARQLSDDLHDWEDDLRKGIITKVVSDLARDHAARCSDSQTSSDDIHSLRATFWLVTAERISRDILDHLKAAEASLRTIGVIRKPELLMRQTLNVKLAAETTLATRKQVLEFLDAL